MHHIGAHLASSGFHEVRAKIVITEKQRLASWFVSCF